MHKQLTILSAITALAHQAHAKTSEALGWGPRFSLGRDYVAASTISSWIRESNTTLVLPAVLAISEILHNWKTLSRNGSTVLVHIHFVHKASIWA